MTNTLRDLTNLLYQIAAEYTLTKKNTNLTFLQFEKWKKKFSDSYGVYRISEYYEDDYGSTTIEIYPKFKVSDTATIDDVIITHQKIKTFGGNVQNVSIPTLYAHCDIEGIYLHIPCKNKKLAEEIEKGMQISFTGRPRIRFDFDRRKTSIKIKSTISFTEYPKIIK